MADWFVKIGSETVESLEQALKKDITLVKNSGWNSQNLLHKAVLCCHIEIIRLLLKYGSDPNNADGSGRTPVHYACLKGRLDVLVTLIQFSGDITLVDATDQTCVHLAAMAGSVLILHYLHTVHNQPLNIKDRNLITPLHIACNQGQFEALKYLLRDNRCKIDDVDLWGNSPLHLAAHNGSEASCWEIVSHSLEGTRLLTFQDKHKRMPCDLVKDSRLIRQKELYKWLEKWRTYYENTGCQIPPPNLLWFGSLLLTPIWFLVTVTLCRLFSFLPNGFIALPSFICLAVIVFRKSHRISHPARYPEPVFAGLFASGFVSTALCYMFNTHGYIYSNFLFNIFTTMAIIGTTYFMGIIFLGNPGLVCTRKTLCYSSNPKFFFQTLLMGHYSFNFNFQPLQKIIDTNLSMLPSTDYTVADVALGYSKEDTFCDNCEIVKPYRVRHCKLCNSCCWRMDHHCLFIAKCVAGLNHRSFVFLLMFVILGSVMYITSTISYWYEEFGSLTSALQHSWCCDIWTLTMFVGNILCICWDGSMLIYQIDVMSHGSSTILNLKNKGQIYKKRTMKDKLTNIAHFMKYGQIQIQSQENVFNL